MKKAQSYHTFKNQVFTVSRFQVYSKQDTLDGGEQSLDSVHYDLARWVVLTVLGVFEGLCSEVGLVTFFSAYSGQAHVFHDILTVFSKVYSD